MFGTFILGQLFGITLRVHRLVVVLLAAIIVLGALNGAKPVLPIICLVLALLAHEFGHALVARRLGVRVIDIVLWPLGGMARMAEVPEDAGVEARIAVAGPAVNLVLAGVTLALGPIVFGDKFFDPETLRTVGHPASIAQLFLSMNLLLGVGNLLPAFPMDGGRLLRSGLAGRGMSWLDATELAVRVSRWIAVLMIFGAFLWMQAFWVLFPIGLFVLVEGTRELWSVRLRQARTAPGGVGIDLGPLFRGAMGAGAAGPLGRAFGGQAPGPAGDAPAATNREAEADGGGFSDEDIERLETFRGRLRKPSAE